MASYPAAIVVLDAGALNTDVAAALPGRRNHGIVRCILTPHAGEMANLVGDTKRAVEAAPQETALGFAARYDVAVVLKGATTWIAMRGQLWRHAASNVGLATSGSGDTLAGVIAGLAARGAAAEQAAAWGVALHAMAGARLVRRRGTLGILGRELAHEIPAIMDAISRRDAP
jgi:NAD(P)H-hydrate repair Nnr-like enzyme with NAD(P)H-hydrate dehydratase domain